MQLRWQFCNGRVLVQLRFQTQLPHRRHLRPGSSWGVRQHFIDSIPLISHLWIRTAVVICLTVHPAVVFCLIPATTYYYTDTPSSTHAMCCASNKRPCFPFMIGACNSMVFMTDSRLQVRCSCFASSMLLLRSPPPFFLWTKRKLHVAGIAWLVCILVLGLTVHLLNR